MLQIPGAWTTQEHCKEMRRIKGAQDEIFANGVISDDEIGADPLPIAFNDTIDNYLEEPLVSVERLHREGLLGYWNNQQQLMPRVAKFALGILSAPASSVDAERAFSGGRLAISHLQHSIGDFTFEAKMAVGSWYNTPLLPSVDAAADIIAEKLRA